MEPEDSSPYTQEPATYPYPEPDLPRVALLIQHATRRHIVVCGLSGSTIFFDITS